MTHPQHLKGTLWVPVTLRSKVLNARLLKKVLCRGYLQVPFDVSLHTRKDVLQMASVNYEKFKSVQQVKAVIRHCDKEERLNTQQHSNDDINKNATGKNIQLKRDYATTCQRFDDRIQYLDSFEHANRRKDRVVCFGLNVPVPADLNKQDQRDWFIKVYEIIGEQYGKQNILNMYVHRDEIHEYTDATTGDKRNSREHMHVLVVPESNNKLNGKWFSSKSNMIKLNNAIEKMSQDDYGIKFMDGSKKRSKDTVEALKRRSEALEYENSIKVLETQKKALQSEIEVLQQQRDLLQETDAFDTYKARMSSKGETTSKSVANVIATTKNKLDEVQQARAVSRAVSSQIVDDTEEDDVYRVFY